MRSTITLNGQESSDIEGLLIQSLPPISKPLMRTQIEEIDGRDGDVITKLGFSAYTKQITIGLYGDFDIDEVIAYFNSEGTVTFSNEPDKYYNYQIIDQIDFERLIRFRTATVTFHVQPFKYSLDENAKTFNQPLDPSGTNIATLDQSLNTDSSNYTYSSNTQTDVTASKSAAGGKFFATFTMEVVRGKTYFFSGSTSRGVSMYGYKDNIWGTSAGFSGRALANGFSFVPSYTGTLIVGFYASTTGEFYIRDFEVETGVSTVTTFSLTNGGNYFSRPQLTLTGVGTVNLSLNGNQIFVINFEECGGQLTIDTNAMEAYVGTVETLANRAVDGDYNNFKFNIGKNTLTWDGYISKIVINNYSRWI